MVCQLILLGKFLYFMIYFIIYITTIVIYFTISKTVN